MVPCPICGNEERGQFRLYYDGIHKLYRCDECSFVAEYPGPGKSAVVHSYNDVYSLNFARAGKAWMYPERAQPLEDIVDRICAAGGTGKLLDVGCGDGQFLSICDRKGLETFGVEDSHALSGYAREHTRAQITHGQYALEMFPEASFDVVSFIQVVEHIPQPREILATARSHLRPGGILCVEVPSRFAPHFLLYQATRIRWFIDPPRGVIPMHVGYHHPASVRRLASDVGFDEITLTTGRWAPKYLGWKHRVGKALDPVLDRLSVGGILYLGHAR